MKSWEVIEDLTSGSTPPMGFENVTRQFALDFGWRPSYYIDDVFTNSFSNAHLVIEHGLENAAVITFLKNTKLSELTNTEIKNLLSISYNNLIDWHIIVERSRVSILYNRSQDNYIQTRVISQDDLTALRYESFEKIVGRRPNPNIETLDDKLIERISHWRVSLPIESDQALNKENLSALFNTLFFIRAVEDTKYRNQSVKNRGILIDIVSREIYSGKESKISDVFRLVFKELSLDRIPAYIYDNERILNLNDISLRTFRNLVEDFYSNRHYSYDFSLMTKHALGKIYEKYVSELRIVSNAQPTLFNLVEESESDKSFGSVYTPQYIATFFSRCITKYFPSGSWDKLKIIDPACGSGIFLRNTAEILLSEFEIFRNESAVNSIFHNIYGLDVDYNAARASQLSLALLYLSAVDSLPDNLNIFNEESFAYISANRKLLDSFDIVLSNPPYINIERMRPEVREGVEKFLAENRRGRIDTYIAFLIMSIRLLKPGGYGFFVIPHSFMIAENAQWARKFLLENCWVKYIVDLSGVRVFKDVNTYVILLVIQKKMPSVFVDNQVTLVQVNDLPGHALEAAIENRYGRTAYYGVFKAEGSILDKPMWTITSDAESEVIKTLDKLPKLSDYLVAKQGFLSGSDKIFIVDQEIYDNLEKEVFVQYLPDKSMKPYVSSFPPQKYFFFPVNSDDFLITEEEMQDKFPKTWGYLKKNEDILRKRKSANNENWWRPVRTRKRQDMMRPKIIGPHLMIYPKFSIDLDGEWSVSHSVYFHVRDALREKFEVDILKFLCVIMNSSVFFWYISKKSHKYNSNYLMIEVKTTKDTPVPDFFSISGELIREIVSHVDRILENGKFTNEDYRLLDSLAIRAYGVDIPREI